MPRIQEYNSQISAPGPVDVHATAADFGSQIGQGLENLGQGAEAVGQFLDRKAKSDEVAKIHADTSKMNSDWVQRNNDNMKSAEPGADVTSYFSENYDKDMDAYAETIQTDAGRRYFERERAANKKEMLSTLMHGQAELAGEAFKANEATASNEESNQIRTDPTLYQAKQEGAKRYFDAQVENGMPRVQALELQTAREKKNAVAAIEGWATRNAPMARQLINNGEFSDKLSAPEIETMLTHVRQQEHINLEDAELKRRLKKEQISDADEAEKKRLMPSAMDGTIDLKALAVNPKLTSAGIENIRSIALSAAREGTHARTDKTFLNNVFEKMWGELKPGEDRMNQAEFEQYLQKEGIMKGKLAINGSEGENFHELVNLYAGTNTPEGKTLKQGEDRFYGEVKNVVGWDTEHHIFQDKVHGQENADAAWRYYLQKKQEYVKAGKRWSSLMDSKDTANYIMPDIRTKFGQSPLQIMNGITGKVGGIPQQGPSQLPANRVPPDLSVAGDLRRLHGMLQGLGPAQPARVDQILKLWPNADTNGRASFTQELKDLEYKGDLPGSQTQAPAPTQPSSDVKLIKRPNESWDEYLIRRKGQK